MITIEALYNIYLKSSHICTDTRKISKNCLFFALKGDNFDGNTFSESALSMGASYAIIDNPEFNTSLNTILVDDVLTTLQDLARFHRSKLNIPVIGLTGSNGKTTTKELINKVLSAKFKTFATEGNLNNHIGVPLSILSIKNDVEIAIIEMGANHQQEITALCNIALPTHGLITNIGKAHLEGFGGFEGVKLGKAELYKYLSSNNGVIFVNRNNGVLMEMAEKYPATKEFYGDNPSNLLGELIETNPFIKVKLNFGEVAYDFQMHITGDYNFENIIAAAYIGWYFKIEPKEIVNALSNYIPTNNRSQIKNTAFNTVICDFYNANPSSMHAAILNLMAQNHPFKVAILGDMFELGDESAENHRSIIASALNANFNETLFIGEQFFKELLPGAKFFRTKIEAENYLKHHPIKNALVLIKGSRGMALEQLLPLF